MWLVSWVLSCFWSQAEPALSAKCLYEGWDRKNFLSAACACLMSFFPSISF